MLMITGLVGSVCSATSKKTPLDIRKSPAVWSGFFVVQKSGDVLCVLRLASLVSLPIVRMASIAKIGTCFVCGRQ